MARYDQIAGSVNERFEQTSEYAASAWVITQDYITLLGQLIPPGYDLADLDVAWEDLHVEVASANLPDRPDTTLVIPEFPTNPVLGTVDDIDPVDIPVLDVVPPSYREPDFPDDEMPTIPTDLPATEPISYPTAPAYVLPDDVDIGPEIVVEDPPDTTLPEFDVEAPEFNIQSPGNAFAYSEGDYSSDLLDAVKAWLSAQLAAGGTGLDAEVYDAIIDRAEARQLLKHQDMYEETEQYFAGRHHTLPSGPLSGRLLYIQSQIGFEEQQLSDDTMIEEGRLAQTNTHFIVEKSLGYENMMIGHFNAVAQRAFEVARAVQMAAMETFNALVAHYNAQNEGYKTKASVYEIRIRASTLVLERYKVLLEGKKLQGDLKKLILEQYNLQLDGIKTLVSIYATEMSSAKIKADVNASIIEGFRVQIGAYSTIIGGITAKYNAYQSQLAGEQTKADVYKTQVQAYGAQVDGIAKGAQVNIEQVKAQLGVNQMLIQEYIAELDGIKARIGASSTEVLSKARHWMIFWDTGSYCF